MATRLEGPRSALWGEGDLVWTSCAPAVLGPGPTHDVVVRGDEALRPAAVTLRAQGSAADQGSTTPVPVSPLSPTHLAGTVASGPERVLALAMNHNDGWRATLDGAPLTPLVVDGFRQGYLVPAGAAGTLDVVFTPDTAYRWTLGAALVLVLLLVAGLLVPDRSRRVEPAAGTAGAVPRLAAVATCTVVYAVVVAGPWAGLAAAVALAVLRVRRSDADAPVAVAVVALVTGAGVLVAATHPTGPTPSWVEATATLAVIAAGALAGAAPVVRPSAWPGARWRRGSARPGRG